MKAPRILRRRLWRLVLVGLPLVLLLFIATYVYPGWGRVSKLARIAFASSGMALMFAGFLIRRRLHRSVRKHNYRVCPECGYLLYGLPDAGRCPECGLQYEYDKLKWLWQECLDPLEVHKRDIGK